MPNTRRGSGSRGTKVAPRRRAQQASDQYLELVRNFPLRPIRSRQQHAVALAHLTETSLRLQKSQDLGVADYLDTLAYLIDVFEHSAGMKVDTSQVGPARVIRHLIEEQGLSVSALARGIGIGQSNLSEMLSGRRDFSKKAIVGLCKRFGLVADVFFPEIAGKPTPRLRGAA